MLEVGAADRQQPVDLRQRVGLGPALGRTRARQVALQVREGPLQHPLVEEAHPADRHVERAAGLVALEVELEQVAAQFLVAEGVGRSSIILGQARHSMHVGFAGFIGVTAQGDLLDESLS